MINPLPPINHDEVRGTVMLFCVLIGLLKIDYPPFHRNFYHEHSEIAAMTHPDVQKLRKKLGLSVRVFGYHVS